MDFLTSLDFWLWAAAVLLALLYLMAGFMKATQPIDKLAGQMKWPGDYPRLTRFVGWAEVLGAIGLILPLATGILSWLTPLARRLRDGGRRTRCAPVHTRAAGPVLKSHGTA